MSQKALVSLPTAYGTLLHGCVCFGALCGTCPRRVSIILLCLWHGVCVGVCLTAHVCSLRSHVLVEQCASCVCVGVECVWNLPNGVFPFSFCVCVWRVCGTCPQRCSTNLPSFCTPSPALEPACRPMYLSLRMSAHSEANVRV